jgi:hypothetical protein
MVVPPILTHSASSTWSLQYCTQSYWVASSTCSTDTGWRFAFGSGISRSSSRLYPYFTSIWFLFYSCIHGTVYSHAQPSSGSCLSFCRRAWLYSRVRWYSKTSAPANIFAVCNARVLAAYESQRRLTRNYLEGARKRRLSYTPQGLWQAWKDLDATSKVYIGSIAGFVISVS